MPNNNNPLGSYMPDAHKQRVVTLLQQANITLIEDDVYGTLSYERPRPKAAKAYDKTGNVILCSSFSKTIAPGYRIGWLFSNTLSERMEYHKFLANISTATLPQLALAEFLARGSYSRNAWIDYVSGSTNISPAIFACRSLKADLYCGWNCQNMWIAWRFIAKRWKNALP
jgi:DNA-binding transcriptional MocR family regulator